MIFTLDVVWTTRSGGLGQTKRRYLDFVIDGVPLSSRLNVDAISPFGWVDERAQETSIDARHYNELFERLRQMTT